jgi:hypothetical protein
MFRLDTFGPWLRRSRCDSCGFALWRHIWADFDNEGRVVACAIKDQSNVDNMLREILSQSTSVTPVDPGD